MDAIVCGPSLACDEDEFFNLFLSALEIGISVGKNRSVVASLDSGDVTRYGDNGLPEKVVKDARHVNEVRVLREKLFRKVNEARNQYGGPAIHLIARVVENLDRQAREEFLLQRPRFGDQPEQDSVENRGVAIPNVIWIESDGNLVHGNKILLHTIAISPAVC